MDYFRKDFADARPEGQTLFEESPVKSSKSNGIVERATRSVEEQLRTMRSALESRLGVKWEYDHAVWAWMAEYASYLLNRFEVGHDENTSYERCKGKRLTKLAIECFKSVRWKRRLEGRGLCKWEEGVFLG